MPSERSGSVGLVIYSHEIVRIVTFRHGGHDFICRIIGYTGLLGSIVLAHGSKFAVEVHRATVLHPVVDSIALEPVCGFKSVDNRREMLFLNGKIGIGTGTVATWPAGPVGTVVHLSYPYGTFGAVMDRTQSVEPAAPVAVPVAVHHYKITTPSAGVDRIDETIEPVEITRHGRRTEPTTCGHHLRPCGKHFLDSVDLLAVVIDIVGFIVAEDAG